LKLLRVAATVINQTPFDWRGNVRRIRAVLKEARSERVHILCLPELCISGYGCEDAFHMPHLVKRSWQCLMELLPETREMAVTIGLPVRHRGTLFNATAIVIDGKLEALVAKRLLAGDGVHYEPRWFKAWPTGVIEDFEFESGKVPIGDVYLDVGGVRIGLEICEEAWVANRPGANLARKGVDILLNPSASHFAFGKLQVRERFVAEGSRSFQVAYVYSNLLGNESGRIVFDGGALIASEGHIVARGPHFSFKEYNLTSAVIDVDLNRTHKSRSGSFQPLLGESDDDCCEVDYQWPYLTTEAVNPPMNPLHQETYAKEEEFTRAVSLGLFDFLRKSRLFGFTISLSGGVDSSAASLLSTLAIRFAIRELGFSGLIERLGYIPGIHQCHDEASVLKILVATAYQSTANSSIETKKAAAAVAKEIGSTHFEWDVEDLVSKYKTILSDAAKVEWNWATHDTTLQNIQARTRSPSIWMLANLNNHLLLATSNRSEAAVGYATMDGDTSGGLSPLAGIDKNFLRKWTAWMLQHGPEGMGTFKSLATVLNAPPTAELRPKSAHQTDEADLMPYDVLDAIERAAIRDKKSPEEVLKTVLPMFKMHKATEMQAWVSKFFTLWCRNQWKRERYAPGFHLDDESLDPKTWCRFPILSGGFAEELESLG
jgi:NAD+ synthase (glutamine-hydrolysing)